MDHLQHQQHHPPPPSYKTFEHETKPKTLLPLSFANGTLKKHRPQPAAAAVIQQQQRRRRAGSPGHDHLGYRECLKNHAASLGGHALDGCGEFMPSPNANPAEPTSLTCAACGCHRNFHRRLPLHGGGGAPYNHQHHREDRDDDDRGEDDEEEEDGDEVGEDHHISPRPPHHHPNPYYSSAPHMLLALSAGLPGGEPGPIGTVNAAPPTTTTMATATATTPATAAAPYRVAASTAVVGGAAMMLPRKRFRSKFSAEQKEKMHELSERLGWRMQKRDEAVVEECCRQIGVTRGVFKVWMHNNKHTLHGGGSSKKDGDPATGVIGGDGGGNEGTDTNNVGNGNGNGNTTTTNNNNNGNGAAHGNHAMNGSSPSSS